MSAAIFQIDRPMYLEAREFADRHDVTGLEALEQIRRSMCVREFRKQMRPWNDMLAKCRPLMYSVNRGEPLPDAYVALQAQVNEMAILTAQRLGLDTSPMPPQAKSRF